MVTVKMPLIWQFQVSLNSVPSAQRECGHLIAKNVVIDQAAKHVDLSYGV